MRSIENLPLSPLISPLTKSMTLVETVSLRCPDLADASLSGNIAAAHGLNALWATGARAVSVRPLAAWPASTPVALQHALMAGMRSKVKEVGLSLAAGVVLPASEIQLGLVVTGQVHPQRLRGLSGAKEGDVLMLTKPIGSGIGCVAMRQGVASKTLVRRLMAQLKGSSLAAAETFASGAFVVNALCALSERGLLGHSWDMARASNRRLVLELERVPLLPEVAQLSEQGVYSASGKHNANLWGKEILFPRGLPDAIQLVLSDGQVNGGLLAAVPVRHLPKALAALEKAHVESWVIGQWVKGKAAVELV